MPRLRSVLPMLSVLAFLLLAPRVLAQSAPEAVQPWSFAFGVGALAPVGTFGEHTSPDVLLDMSGRYRAHGAAWGVVLNGGFASVAHSDTTYALAGLDVDVRHASQLYWFTLGPEWGIAAGRGEFLLHAGAGALWSLTRSYVTPGTSSGNTNRSDAAFAAEAGAAYSWPIPVSTPMAIELGVRYLLSSAVGYVPESGIRRVAGQLQLSPREDPVSAVELRAAVRFGVPAKNPRKP